jgi:DNA-binding transcriptional MerR regulator
MKYSVNQVSKLSGVSVRTLHYYDEIALLKPMGLAKNGYRFYGEEELLKLQHILFFRELEFPLKKIIAIFKTPKFNPEAALLEQGKLLEMKKERLEKLLKLINKTMNDLKNENENINPEEMFDALKDEDYVKYKSEVEERWGNTKAYQQSKERLKKMTAQDMQRIKVEGLEITKLIADNMDAGVENRAVQEQVQRHFEHINRFYDCSPEMYVNLGKMYVEDPRFKQYYENVRLGLAEFMYTAMQYFAKHQKK